MVATTDQTADARDDRVQRCAFEIEIHLITSLRPVDLDAEDIDVAIRAGQLDKPVHAAKARESISR
jgi:DNA-binding transcriptional LysR family regulator